MKKKKIVKMHGDLGGPVKIDLLHKDEHDAKKRARYIALTEKALNSFSKIRVSSKWTLFER